MNIWLPGHSLELTFRAATGLVGTAGIRLVNNQGGTTIARTTAGIIEYPAASGLYAVTIPAESRPDDGDYTAIADIGTVSPTSVAAFAIRVSTAAAEIDSPTDTFATTDDLAARLGITLTEAEATRATTLIQLATALIQQETGQHILLVEDDSITMPGRADSTLRLPQRPVQSVASVSISGQALTAGTDYVLVGDTLIRGLGWDRTLNAPWGLMNQTVTVTYTHGFTAVPGIVRAVCLEMVARVWVNPGSVGQEIYGSVQVQHGNPGIGLTMTEAERKTVRDAIRRTAGTVTT